MLEAVERLGYAPNSAAKNLRTLRSSKLLVTVPDISNPFFSLILQGIEDAAQRDGYAVLLGDTQHDEQREERYALMLKQQGGGRPDLPRPPPAEGRRRARARRWRRAARRSSTAASSAPSSASPASTSTTRRAAAGAMDHLYDLGHRRIGVVTGPLVSPLSRDRLPGAIVAAPAPHGAESRRRSSATAISRSSPARTPRDACWPRTTRRPRSSASTTRWRSASSTSPQRRGLRVPRRSVGRRLRRHPLRAVHRSAADDDRPADARHRRRHGAPAARDPQRQPDRAGVGHAAAHAPRASEHGGARSAIASSMLPARITQAGSPDR